MYNTRLGTRVHTIRDREYVTEGQRINNTTIQRHYQVEYPKDLN